MTQSNPYHESASRGAALLDERNPGWWRRIDLDSLELDHCQHCVAGQLFGDYGNLSRELGYKAHRDRAELGFNLEVNYYIKEDLFSDERQAKWTQLTEAWKSIIRARLETDR